MMELFFKPRSVAIVGASGSPGKLGYVIVNNIKGSDFAGAVYPVNPKADEILGYKVDRFTVDDQGDPAVQLKRLHLLTDADAGPVPTVAGVLMASPDSPNAAP